LDRYLADSLDESEREIFRDHLRSCETCREWAIEAEPTLAFSAFHPPPADRVRVEQCAQNLLTSIRQERMTYRLRSGRRAWLAAAAALVVTIGAGAAWRLVSSGGKGPPGGLTEHSDAVIETQPPPEVRVDMREQGVKVYRFAEEDGDDTAVYFIVNPALES